MPDRQPYLRHLTRIFNSPLLIAGHALDAMMPGLEMVLRNEAPRARPEPEAFVTSVDAVSKRSGLRMAGPVAVIPVYGPLVHRGRYDAECNWIAGYQEIARDLLAFRDDPEAMAAVMVFDSPGGEVAGCFDTVALIGDVGKVKPIHAAVSESALSAAYALASACKTISITSTAIVGSIGVLMRHVDISAYLAREGFTITQIYAGARKVDGNPYEPLPEPVREKFQGQIDSLYDTFVDLVASRRALSPKAVRDTEAEFFMGQAGIQRGLADRIETPDALISRLAEASRGVLVVSSSPAASAAQSTNEVPSMSNPLPETVTTALGLPADASEDQAVSRINALGAEARDQEHARIFAILDCPEAKGRETQAVALARVREMTPEASAGVLKTLPAAAEIQPAKPAADNQFARLMTRMGNPDVGPDEDLSDDQLELRQIRNGWAAAFTTSETR